MLTLFQNLKLLFLLFKKIKKLIPSKLLLRESLFLITHATLNYNYTIFVEDIYKGQLALYRIVSILR